MTKRKTIHILRRISNATVTSHNFYIIHNAALLTGTQINNCTTIRNVIKKGRQSDLYIVTSILDVIFLSLLGRKNIFFWVQGIAPEESFMRNNSKIRERVLSIIEKYALKKAIVCSFVSKSMEAHYISKYNLQLKNTPYIFPCFNTTINKPSFFQNNKYSNNCFVYAGGLAVWQHFDETLRVYKYFEDLDLPNTKLMVLTQDKETAEIKIIKEGITNYCVDFVSKDDLPDLLSEAKFGFVLREDHIVNRVSTPTKISTYLSCGVIPIFGSCIASFAEQAVQMKYAIKWAGEQKDYQAIKLMMKSKINASDVYEEYEKLFDSYYSTENHMKLLSIVFAKMIKQPK